jgi:hypothetical protein
VDTLYDLTMIEADCLNAIKDYNAPWLITCNVSHSSEFFLCLINWALCLEDILNHGTRWRCLVRRSGLVSISHVELFSYCWHVILSYLRTGEALHRSKPFLCKSSLLLHYLFCVFFLPF